MHKRPPLAWFGVLPAVLLWLAACTPAPAPSPTATPARPLPATVPVTPAAKPAAGEQTVADFYRGKTVRLIVGFSAGGG